MKLVIRPGRVYLPAHRTDYALRPVTARAFAAALIDAADEADALDACALGRDAAKHTARVRAGVNAYIALFRALQEAA